MCQLMTPCLLDVTIIAHKVDVIFVSYKRERDSWVVTSLHVFDDITSKVTSTHWRCSVMALCILQPPQIILSCSSEVRSSSCRRSGGIHPHAPVALSLNVKNAVLTSATVHMCLHVPVWRSHDSDSVSLSVFYRKRRFIARVRYSAHSDLYIWEIFEIGVLRRMKMEHFCWLIE